MNPLAAFVGLVLAPVIVLLLATLARRRARRRLTAATAAGQPLTADVRAYLMVTAGRAARWRRARRGTIRVRPGSVSWQPRSGRHPGADLTGARLAGTRGAPDIRRDHAQDLVAGYQITLQRDEERYDFCVRRTAVALVETGLAQAGAAADPGPGQTSLSA